MEHAQVAAHSMSSSTAYSDHQKKKHVAQHDEITASRQQLRDLCLANALKASKRRIHSRGSSVTRTVPLGWTGGVGVGGATGTVACAASCGLREKERETRDPAVNCT